MPIIDSILNEGCIVHIVWAIVAKSMVCLGAAHLASLEKICCEREFFQLLEMAGLFGYVGAFDCACVSSFLRFSAVAT